MKSTAESAIWRRLARLRRRLRLVNLWAATVSGVLVGGLGALAVLLVGAAAGADTRLLALLLGTSFTAAWAVAGVVREPDLTQLARLVDERAGLKDRTASALEFSAKPVRTPCEQLELEDAARALEQLPIRAILPWHLPKALPAAAGVVIAGLTLLWLAPWWTRSVQANQPERLPQVTEAATEANELLEELKREAEKAEDRELERLVEKLQLELQELYRPGTDVQQALATLSEIQQRLEAHRKQLQAVLAEPVLAELAEVFERSAAFQAVAAPIKKGNYGEAARRLQQMNKPPKTPKGFADRLRRVASKAKQSGAEDLSGALSNMAETLDASDDGSEKNFKQAAEELARSLRRRDALRRMCRKIGGACRRLGECKGRCAGRGGNPKRGTSRNSKRPSSRWGLGPGSKELGEPTELGALKQLERLSGIQGEGPSSREVTTTAEARQQAARAAAEVFERYLRMSEEVLESEPIPLGQRQLIRRYFELIRPRDHEEP